MSHGGRPGLEPSESSRGSVPSPSESGVTSTLGTTQSSRLASSSGVPSTETSNQETLPSPATGQVGVLKILEEITESFRGGKSSKTEAVAAILRVIGENVDVSLTQSQREEAFDSYLTEILSAPPTQDNSGQPESSGPRPGDRQGPSGSSNTSSAAKKNRNVPESGSDDEDDKPSKKQRLLESDMPWYSETGESTGSYSHPSCEETCRLLRAYN